jgi:hypothetical protein
MGGSNASLQASLRCLDWRFLLPNPPESVFQHLVLLGGPAGLHGRIVEIGLARRVSCKTPRSRSADAVIILHDAQVPLSDVAACLLPGGTLYCEINRRSPLSPIFTPGRLRRALQNVGLSTTGTYLTIPNFANRQMYLTLDVPGAMKWYLETLFIATTPAWRLLEPALRALAWFGTCPLRLLSPCYAMTAIAGAARDAPPSMLSHPGLPSDLRSSDVRPLVLTPGEQDLNRVILLPFAPGGDRPLGVLKFSRLPDRNAFTENEQTVLTTIRTSLNEAMRRTIPQPLGTLRWGELSVGVESCAAGRLLSTSTGRWITSLRQKLNDLHLAAAWLTEFHCQAQIKRLQWGVSEWHEWVETPLAAYEQAFGMTASEKRLFDTVRRRASSLVGATLPLVWQHYAFGAWNIYRANHKINVVDWESGEAGLPLFDLIYFVTHWSYTVHGLRDDAAQLHGFRQLFCEPERADPFSIAVRETITQYMARLGIDHSFLPLLLVLTWVVRAPGHISRDQALGKGTNPRNGNRYVGYIGALAEHVERLFAETHGM